MRDVLIRLLLVSAMLAQSPSTVAVVVRSAAGPVAGARVVAGHAAVITDALGQASLPLDGPVALTVQADGFLPASVDLPASPPSTLEVILEPVPGVTEEVLGDTTRTATRLADQPLRVEVIDRDEIEEKALMTPGSVAMLLAETTGLRVQTTAPSLGAANVRVNGLRGRYTQLLADGLPLYGSQGDSLSLLQVPPLDLARVEIVKGAASALYGPTALGGVVNLVTRRPVEDSVDVLANVTSQAGIDLAGFAGRRARTGWGATLLGGVHSQQAQDLDRDGWTDVPGFTRGVVRPRVFFDSGGGRTVFATLGLNAENRRGGAVDGAVAPDGRPFPQALDSRRADAGLVARVVTRSSRVVALRGSVARASQHRTFGQALDRGVRVVWFGESSVAGVRGVHSWVVGAAVQQDRYRNDSVPGVNFTFTTPGAFVQDDIRFADSVSASLSARIDVHSEYGALVNPRASVLVRPAGGWTARVSTGLGTFAPTPFTEETEEVGFSRFRPPEALGVERAWASSVDLARQIGPFELTMTGFSSRVTNQAAPLDLGDRLFTLVTMDGPAWTWGAESVARYRVEGVSVVGTYAWTRATEMDPESGARRGTPLTPRHAATLTAIVEGEDWGRLGVEAYYTGRQALDEDPYRQVSRAYVLVGVLAERRLGRLRVFVNAENLGNVRQTRYARLVRPTRRPDGRWTVDAWAPLDGLVVNGGVRVVLP